MKRLFAKSQKQAEQFISSYRINAYKRRGTCACGESLCFEVLENCALDKGDEIVVCEACYNDASNDRIDG